MISGCAVITRLARSVLLIDPRIITGGARTQADISVKGTFVVTQVLQQPYISRTFLGFSLPDACNFGHFLC